METQNKVVELINSTNASGDKEAKILGLQQIQELVVNKTPALLESFFEEVTAFGSDKSAEVRSQVVVFIEAACKKDKGLLPRALKILALFLDDASVKVQKRVIQACTNLYRGVFVVAANHPTDRYQSMWRDMQSLKTTVLAKRSSTNAGVMTAVLKFAEMLVLSYTTRTHGAQPIQKGGQNISLDMVPFGHRFLQSELLRSEGRQHLQLLAALMKTDGVKPGTITSVVGSLAAIARQRPTLMGQVIAELGELEASPPQTLKPSQLASVRRTLKVTLMTLLRHDASSGLHETLVPLLERLEADPRELSALDKRGVIQQDASQFEAPVHKRARTEAPLPTFEELSKLPLNLVAELVMASMSRVPDTIPDSLLSMDGSGATAAAATSEEAATSEATEAIAEGSKRIKEEMAAVAAMDVKTEQAGPVALSRKRKLAKFLLAAEPLESEATTAMLHGALERLLSAEASLTEGDASRFRTALISRFVSQQALHEELSTDDLDPLSKLLLTYLLRNFKAEFELAMAWLFHEHAICTGLARGFGRYELCLSQLLLGLENYLEEADRPLYRRVLLECPSVTEPVVSIVRDYCREPSQEANGLAALRDCALLRPPTRGLCLPVLLDNAFHGRPDTLQARSILMCKRLCQVPALKATVREFAEGKLQALLEPVAEASDGTHVEWTTDLMRDCLLLYYALCHLEPSLLQGLAEVYGSDRMTREKRELVLKTVADLVQSIGMQDPGLLHLIEHFPAGSDSLVLRILYVLTAKEAPSVQLLAIVKRVYAGNKNARFLMPILDGLSKAELIAELPRFVSLGPLVNEFFKKLLSATKLGASALSPSELLVALHKLDEKRDGVLIKHIIEATNQCFQRKRAFTQEVLAVVLQQLVDMNPLPKLFMRTVIMSLQSCPRLKGFIMSILSRLVSKQVWKDAELFRGFVKCAELTTPRSFHVLFMLPPRQLEHVFELSQQVRGQLLEHVRTMPGDQRAGLPQALLPVLGLA